LRRGKKIRGRAVKISMSIYRKLLSQTAVYGLSSVVGRIINWGLTPLYVNRFTLEEYGIFSDLYALTFFPLIILTFGMETAFFRYAAPQDANTVKTIYANAFYAVLGLAFIFLSLGLFWQTSLQNLLGYAHAPHYIVLMLCIIFLDVVAALPLAKLRYDNKAIRFATIALLNIFLTLSLNLIFILVFNLGVAYVFIANVIASGIRLLMSLWQNLPALAELSMQKIKQLMGYGFFIMLAGLAGAVNETLDRTLIPRLWVEGLYKGIRLNGWEMNGIYGASYKLGMFITLVTQAFRYAAEPFFFKKAAEANAPIIFAKIFHYYGIGAFVAVLGVSLFAYEIVAFNAWGLLPFTLVPRNYWQGLEAVPFILCANLFLGLYLNLSIWFKLTKKVYFGVILAGLGALITISLNLLTIPKLGYMGSAYATCACYASMTILCYYWGKRYYPIPYQPLRLCLYAAFGCGLYILLGQFGQINGPGLCLPKLLVMLLFTLTLYAYEKIAPLQWPSLEKRLPNEG
jgi:O-antigen/teichoic acid export membrane protein